MKVYANLCSQFYNTAPTNDDRISLKYSPLFINFLLLKFASLSSREVRAH